ncbi:hypothetical protein A2781_00930 [Candidatus Gottesmanbacteria bacterium RIFCSPHIGHO2_01_FULL_42_27]|nr:MAG: hypothetical protein A2781_00930 [Candidatus Gottesmanbacteria bacterium RIFCSPHIGHO2_01_FULL_42_27]
MRGLRLRYWKKTLKKEDLSGITCICLLNAEYKFRPAQDASESILILGEEGVIEKDFAKHFSKIAGFRNILIHEYLKIDYKIVADNLNKYLADFEKFARQVAKYLT